MNPSNKMTVRRLSHALGAEISGVDLTKPIDSATIENILDIWNENHVLLFRGNLMAPKQIVAFAGSFGPPMHMALADFDPSEPRYMLRATLLGEPSGTVINVSDSA